MCLHSHCLGEKRLDGIQPHCALKAAKHLFKNKDYYHHNTNDLFVFKIVSKQVVKTTNITALLNKKKWHAFLFWSARHPIILIIENMVMLRVRCETVSSLGL